MLLLGCVFVLLVLLVRRKSFRKRKIATKNKELKDLITSFTLLLMKSSYVTNKMPNLRLLPQIRFDEAFPNSRNQQMALKMYYNFPLFVLYDCHSYRRIELDVMCSV